MRLTDDDPAARASARGVIHRQVEQLARLVDDLMDASRLNYGKVTLRKQQVDLGAAVRASVETARPQIDARGHHLMVDLPAEPLWIEADPTRLEQILTNLLSNAAKYTEPGGCIGVSSRREGGFAAFRVEDSGLGMTPEMLRHVFDLFSQEGRTRERSEGGLGLGLALVRRLVEAHGGAIEASSPGAGLGSTFTVRLPLGDPSPIHPGHENANPSAPPRRILLVDDDRDSTSMLARLLAARGYEVRAATDGPSALEVAREFVPEVVLLDLGLPGMDGLEVARHLRTLPGSEAATLLALTGREDDDTRRLAAEAGFRRLLVKPIGIADLIRALAN